ncbi:MAG: ABC transporter permease [Gemmatimonadota bacterium]|nr:MAG: ABC transporter permease [Gemmatimonadota bacterium]
MNTTAKVTKYELREVVRGRLLPAYAVFFLVATEALVRFGGDTERALLSLVNLVLILVPLVSVLFGTLHLYAAREFNQVLLAQPVSRRQLFAGLYLGLSLPLVVAVVTGIGLPFLLRVPGGSPHLQILLPLLATAAVLTFIFVALAFQIGIRLEDRVKGIATAFVLWLGFSVVYDGMVLVIATAFYQYPLEKALIALMLVNPVDLGRVIVLMSFDIAALMGYTGATFERFFGSGLGVFLSSTALLVWVAVPLLFALRRFERKDF